MSGLVERLRGWDHCWPAPGLERTVAEAADALEEQDAEIARLREALNRAQWALQPFSDCVLHDNGDVTVNPSHRINSYDALRDAHFAYKAARMALTAPERPADAQDAPSGATPTRDSEGGA